MSDVQFTVAIIATVIIFSVLAIVPVIVVFLQLKYYTFLLSTYVKTRHQEGNNEHHETKLTKKDIQAEIIKMFMK